MLTQIGNHIVYFFHGKLHVVHARELGPAKAKGAIGVTGLSLGGEKQHGFVVFVLSACEFFSVNFGYVVALSRRMGVELMSYFVGCFTQGGGVGSGVDCFGHFGKMLGTEHSFLRKVENENGVVLIVVPVDELINYIVVCFERQHVCHNIYAPQIFLRHLTDLWYLTVIPCGINLILHRRIGCYVYSWIRVLMPGQRLGAWLPLARNERKRPVVIG